MCREHWTRVPPATRAAIWREYRPGQERDKNPSAIMQAAFVPYSEASALVCARYLMRVVEWQKTAIASGFGDPLEGLVPQ
jgi:hypothetical protein